MQCFSVAETAVLELLRREMSVFIYYLTKQPFLPSHKGVCTEGRERMIVTELLPKGDVETLLRNGHPSLTTRMTIARSDYRQIRYLPLLSTLLD